MNVAVNANIGPISAILTYIFRAVGLTSVKTYQVMVLLLCQCRVTGLDWINMQYLKVMGISIEGIGYELCDSSHLFWKNLSTALLLLLYSACAFKHVASSDPVSDRTDTCRFLLSAYGVQWGVKLWTLYKCIMNEMQWLARKQTRDH